MQLAGRFELNGEPSIKNFSVYYTPDHGQPRSWLGGARFLGAPGPQLRERFSPCCAAPTRPSANSSVFGPRRRSWPTKGTERSSTPSSVAFPGDHGGVGSPAGKGAVNALTMAIGELHQMVGAAATRS